MRPYRRSSVYGRPSRASGAPTGSGEGHCHHAEGDQYKVGSWSHAAFLSLSEGSDEVLEHLHRSCFVPKRVVEPLRSAVESEDAKAERMRTM